MTITALRSPTLPTQSLRALYEAIHTTPDRPCTSADPEDFFPVGTSGPALKQIEDAKALCRRCPVVRECLEWTIQREIASTGPSDGISGAMTADERAEVIAARFSAGAEGPERISDDGVAA